MTLMLFIGFANSLGYKSSSKLVACTYLKLVSLGLDLMRSFYNLSQYQSLLYELILSYLTIVVNLG